MDSSTNLEFNSQDSGDRLLQPGWQHTQVSSTKAPVCHQDQLLPMAPQQAIPEGRERKANQSALNIHGKHQPAAGREAEGGGSRRWQRY